MKRLIKSHAFIGALSIFMGLIVSFVLTPIYSQAVEKKDIVVRIKKNISAGSQIQTDDIEEVNVGVFNMSDKIIKRKADVVGKYAKTQLYAGMYIVNDSLSQVAIKQDLYLNDLPNDKYAISVTVHNFAAGLSSKLLQGDLVSAVVKRRDDDGIMICEIPDSLMYMEVLSTTEENGEDKQVVPNTPDDKKDKSKERLATVTLLVNKYQAAELSAYEGEAVIHLALKCRNNERQKAELLKIQEYYFEDLQSVDEETEAEQANANDNPENNDETDKNKVDTGG